MNTQKTLNRSLKFIAKIILGFIVGMSFGFGVGKFIKTGHRLTSSIEQEIQEHCDCESVEKIATVGFQFSKDDGVTNRAISFILKNCKYNGSAKEEAKRINDFLKVAVDNYEAIDLLELSFSSEEDLDLVKIKNGTVL